MRVLEPHYFKQAKSKRPKRPPRQTLFIIMVLVLGTGIGGYLLFGQKPGNTTNTSQTDSPVTENTPAAPKQLRHFTAEEFKRTYSSYIYPNTQLITKAPEITGNAEADARLRKVAEARGYKLTALPVASIVKTGEPGLEGDDLIQPNAQIAWQDMKAAATKDGIPLKLTSAYRSIDYQRTLFLRRMQNARVNTERILEGFADDEIDAILARAALPGYSRHHTGYTIDLSCNGVGLEAFKATACYTWLSKNNFENTKKYGWVPSYPEGVGDVGPEPESWEYIWVGTNATYE